MTSSTDYEWMGRALDLARRAEGQTRPNPAVGAVVVRDGNLLGEGYHERAGLPHAERNALAACDQDPRGATMYVTLEPCNHHGRTPPCTDAILESGIARMVIAQRDPNIEARGGVERLRAAGIDVKTGVRETEARLLNPAFNTFHAMGRPLVTLKWAMSLDGCTSSSSGHSAWISNEASRRRAHELRAAHDAIVVGVETALQDGTRLNVRDVELGHLPHPARLVLDSRLRLPEDHPFVTETEGQAVVICAEDASHEAEERLRARGADVWRLRRAGNGPGVSIPDLLLTLRGRNIQSLLVEGGRRVAGQFVASNAVDRVAVFVAPVLIGSGTETLSALVGDNPITSMSNALRLHHVTSEPIEGDVLVQGWVSQHLFGEL